MVTAGSIAARYSTVRSQIYERMLREPSRPWAVKDLHDALADLDISENAVRSTLYLLLGERVVVEQKGFRAMRVKLTEDGRDVLRVLLESWARQEASA
ncbi:hypothetical protein [Hamadaea tsunoensis]|uniref:hypothetical protein n=1 Tax=Hamadaea tsunoensis TaxID=53368 RepID=UPI0004826107|nr:hypothetical protein [Hamadaea tsunoensis]